MAGGTMYHLLNLPIAIEAAPHTIFQHMPARTAVLQCTAQAQAAEEVLADFLQLFQTILGKSTNI